MKSVRRLVVLGLAGLAWPLGAGNAWAQAGRAYVAEDRGCTGAHRNACLSTIGGDPRRVGGMNDAPGAEVAVVVAGDGDGNRGHGLSGGGSGNIRAVGAGHGQAVWGFRDYRDNFVYSPLPALQASPLEGFQVYSSEAWAINDAQAAVGSTFFFTDATVLPYPTLWSLTGANFTVSRLRTALFPPDHHSFPGRPKPGTARDVNEAGTVVGCRTGAPVPSGRGRIRWC